jgi:hypothetical protein
MEGHGGLMDYISGEKYDGAAIAGREWKGVTWWLVEQVKSGVETCRSEV